MAVQDPDIHRRQPGRHLVEPVEDEHTNQPTGQDRGQPDGGQHLAQHWRQRDYLAPVLGAQR